jgi:hypothetical protein
MRTIAVALLLLAACSPTNHRVVLRELRAQLGAQPHACVPLGWVPVAAGQSFYPGYTAQYQDVRSWLAPLWLGSLHAADLRDAQAKTSFAIMNDLVRKGMMQRITVPGGYHFRLTVAAMKFFYAQNDYRNNSEAWPYLCYSNIVPDRVIWTRRIPDDANRPAFKAGFQWHAGEDAPWAGPFLRAHSVILPPLSHLAVATFVKDQDDWLVWRLSSQSNELPRLADSGAWPMPPHADSP